MKSSVKSQNASLDVKITRNLIVQALGCFRLQLKTLNVRNASKSQIKRLFPILDTLNCFQLEKRFSVVYKPKSFSEKVPAPSNIRLASETSLCHHQFLPPELDEKSNKSPLTSAGKEAFPVTFSPSKGDVDTNLVI